MKKIISSFLTITFLVSLLVLPDVLSAQDAAKEPRSRLFPELVPQGSWQLPEGETAPSSEAFYSEYMPRRSFFVHVEGVPENATSISYGGGLNLKYFSGIAYDYLQKNLPGKTISFSVDMPRSAVSSFSAIPNKLRVTLKSLKDGVWTEYYEGSEWTTVRKEGKYNFKFNIPKGPAPSPSSGEMYFPENTILIAAEYYLMEGAKRMSSVTYSISDFEIDGIGLDQRSLEWQLLVDGQAQKNVFLPSFPAGSTLIYSMDRGISLAFAKPEGPYTDTYAFSGTLKNVFLTLPVYVPRELRRQKGTVALTIKGATGAVRSSVKNFDSCDIEGRVHMTVPLDAFSVNQNVEELWKTSAITLRVKTLEPHTKDMMPFAVEPMKIRMGELIPFDDKWQVRDVQGRGGYTKIDVREDGQVAEGGVTVNSVGPGQYQLNMAARMKGGIDWKNPYYRFELIRDFNNYPVDMDNMHFEVVMSPITDTMAYWQKPFRARIGLVDTSGNILLGPNVSLSEGLSSTASVDVSMTNPIPKGLTMAGFNPHKVKSLILNFESSHTATDIFGLNVNLIDLYMKPVEAERPSALKSVDYSRFKRDPAAWQITKLIKDYGGYVVGINHPFPVIDVSPDVLSVPQIYPGVGMKVADPRHFGFASDITRKTVLEDFTVFANNNITLVRFFLFGHLEGVLTWDEKGRDIKGFGKGMETRVQEAAGMSVERFAEFLNANEEKFFVRDDSGDILGIEKHVMGDLKALLDILEEVEKTTGKRIHAVISLYDFLLGDGTTKEGPLRAYTVGEHSEVVTDPVIKVKTQALIWKILKNLAKDDRFYKYIAVIEIMNEPDNATVLSTRKNFNDLVNFVAEGIYLVKDAVGTSIPVSVGFRSWPPELRFWSSVGEGIDILMIHYWGSLESYNIDVPGMWPLGMPASKLWKYLGTKPNGRLTGMGEIGPGGALKKNLFTMERAGYDFCLIWSYSGHDSYDAKPFLDKLKEYQDASLLFASLKSLPREDLKKIFRYIITARGVFESMEEAGAMKLDPRSRDAAFRSYLAQRPKNMTDQNLKKSMEDILIITEMKGLSLSRKDVRFLFFKIMMGTTPAVESRK